MRSTICVLLLCIAGGSVWCAVETENRAARWENRVQTADAIAESNLQISQAYDHNSYLMETIGIMAVENGLLCERDAKTLQVVTEFDEENRRLKASLGEAARLLEEQIEELNELIDENSRLTYKVEVLERAIDRIPPVDDINITVPN